MSIRTIVLALGLATLTVRAEPPAPFVDPLRGPVPITKSTEPPRLANAVNDDVKRPRNFDKQPPVIPHRVDSYQVDKNFNKCLDCHAKARTEFSRAVPISPTHYMSRSGKTLDHVSTRRYFCLQCHVPQEADAPLVGNSFRNVDALTPGADQPGTRSNEKQQRASP